MSRKILILGIIFVLVLFFNYPKSSSAPTSPEKKYAADELIVKFKDGQEPEDARFEGFDIQPIFINHQNDELGNYYKIKLPKNKNLGQAQIEFEKLDTVEKTTPNYLAKMAYTPNDTYYPSQWALSKINASTAWDITQGSSETTIAVIDSGVDTDHPDLGAKIWTNTADPINGVDDDLNGLIDDNIGWDWVANEGYAAFGPPCIDRDPGDPNRTADNDPNPEPTGLDEDQCLFPGVDTGQHHGTSVSGIAAAITNNTEGIAGVCPNCSVMALRVLDDEGWGDFDEIAAAIVYAADKGAEVINMSLAGPYDDTVMASAINYAKNHDVLMASAAGNGDIFGVGYDIDPIAYKLSPICNDNYDYLDGGENDVIGVAATESNDVKTSWSNFGKKYVDISAPGTGLHAPLNGGGYTTGFGGTSGATPIVAGVLGLVKSLHPTWDFKAVRDATIDLISNINNLNPSYAGKLGGRVNASRALNSSERLNGSGTLIKGSGPAIYLLENGQKRAVLSPEVYFSHFQEWYFATISDSRLDDYPNGPDLIFREGSLIKGSSATVYQIEYPSAVKHPIASAEVFLALGYYWNDVIITSDSIISQHTTSTTISDASTHLAGSLVKTESSAAVYLLQGSGPTTRHPIINAEVFSLKFRWQDIVVISDEEMNTYTLESDFRYPDGSLLKGDSAAVYLISYGKKRTFTSAEAFVNRGYGWNKIKFVSEDELLNYALAEDLN